MPETRISQSRLKTWRRCRKQYDYKHVQGLEPRRIARPLVFGRAVHKMIECQLEGLSSDEAVKEINEDRKGIFTADEEDWDAIVADATDIMQAYREFWKNDKLDYVKIADRISEHKFEMPLSKDTMLTGIIDLVPKTADGRIWVGEHKSHKVLPTEDVRMSDLQGMIYAHVLKTHYKVKRVSGVMWDYIRSKSPGIPTLLKNGTLSKSRIDTLPHVYEREINNQGLDRKDYLDILGDLDDKLTTWFTRVFLPLNQGAIDQLMEETVVTAREIKMKAGVDTTRNFSRDCSWCSYERLCKAELFGMDADFIRNREYRERKKDEETTEPVE